MKPGYLYLDIHDNGEPWISIPGYKLTVLNPEYLNLDIS